MKLKEIDLSKGDRNDHPDIRANSKQYLAKIRGNLRLGRFSKQWYGFNFDCGWGAGIQYDTPGTNSSNWEKLWEIVE